MLMQNVHGIQLTITPLIPLHINYSQLLPQLYESDLCQCLRQNISQLVLSAHMINVNAAILNTFSDKMIPGIYVLASIMMNRILAQSYGRFVINKETDLWSLNAQQFSQQPAEPNTLISCICTCNVLGFT